MHANFDKEYPIMTLAHTHSGLLHNFRRMSTAERRHVQFILMIVAKMIPQKQKTFHIIMQYIIIYIYISGNTNIIK